MIRKVCNRKWVTVFGGRIVLAMFMFWAFNIPFRMVMHILPYSEVRPSNVLPPLLGIIWGIPGAFGTSLANMLGDIYISKISADVYIPGMVINFFYGYLPYVLWNSIGGQEGRQESLPKMDSVSEILKYCIVIFITSTMITPMLAITFQLAGQKITMSNIYFLFFNNFDFSILLGVPLLLFLSFLKQYQKKKKLTIRARAVTGFLILSAAFVTVLGILTYSLLENYAQFDSLKRWEIVYQIVGISIHVLFGVTLLFLWYVEKCITKPLELLTEDMKKFSSMDHIHQTGQGQMCMTYGQIQTGDELQVLAEAFLKMTQDIECYVLNLEKITAEKEKIGAELSVAARIQVDMLPTVFPAFPDKKEFQIFASMYPAKEVGGDFYDYFLVDDNHLGIVIADVSGKGVPAALFMVIAKTLLQNQAKLGEMPWDIFYHVNNQLCQNNSSGMFVTAWLGILELDTGLLLYSNAGHTRPMLSVLGNEFHPFADVGSGFVLGGMENIKFPQGRYSLKKKDILFVYTDGVTEANDCNGRLLGESCLQEVLDSCRMESLEYILMYLKKYIDDFAKGTEQFDDITMLALRYEGNEMYEAGSMEKLCQPRMAE